MFRMSEEVSISPREKLQSGLLQILQKIISLVGSAPREFGKSRHEGRHHKGRSLKVRN